MNRRFVRKLAISSSLAAFAAGTAVAAEPILETLAERSATPGSETIGSDDWGQVRKVIEAYGYDHVSGLAQDQMGVWRGTAVRYGRLANLEIDQNGNFYD